MAKHRTRRVKRSRKGGNIYQTLKTRVLGNKNPVSSTVPTTPTEEGKFSGMNPMVAKQKADQLLSSVAKRIANIPLKVVATTNVDFPDTSFGWEQKAQEKLKAAISAFALANARLIRDNPVAALAMLEGLNNAESDETLWGIVKSNYLTGGRKSRRMRQKTKRFSRRR